ncbi:hypothetical protein PoB_003562500 [Plakobranchus ocellatus]|uniref:Uncharacterized protein n=1 Tax=Plakobranchus ocellatus TaxID=259542 RepID=A0AAV4AQH4_9GAST|nr:hypothetical protein PoB_003562500 [Plakobranchus ocellatus]
MPYQAARYFTAPKLTARHRTTEHSRARHDRMDRVNDLISLKCGAINTARAVLSIVCGLEHFCTCAVNSSLVQGHVLSPGWSVSQTKQKHFLKGQGVLKRMLVTLWSRLYV